MAHEVPKGSIFFLGQCICLGWIMGLFLVDGLVIGFSCLSRSPVNPLGISVENRGLEI
jgi:hypothetical protein